MLNIDNADDHHCQLVMVGVFIFTGESYSARYYARWSWTWC